MVAFLTSELLTTNWMRALSLHDAAAARSDWKDHGPYGTYDGWLGETIAALAKMGRYSLALSIT